MKRLFSALVVALCMMLTANAQDTDAHIHGHVIDKNTGEHLPYIVVILKGTTIGVSTESTGHYMMRNIPEGTFTVEAAAVGYKTQSREINVKKGSKTTHYLHYKPNSASLFGDSSKAQYLPL